MARLKRRIYLISRYKLQEAKITKDMANKTTRCGYCGKEFQAKGLSQTLYLTDNDGIICYECAFAEMDEIQQYGFWLRFASEHFIPCDECQEKLHAMITNLRMALCEPDCITIEEFPKKGNWRFLLRFLGTPSEGQIFTPCEKCQPEILMKIDEKELHIGSDEKPLVELWRKWEMIDEQ